mgnify:CR=1 FL=1
MAVIKRIASKATPKKIVSYLTQEEKTEEKLIGGKDCDPDNVVNDFNMTQELYGKTGGVKYHHIIQSFSPEDNITPEKAHEIGLKLCEKMLKSEYEFVLSTHIDKGHIHNHIIFNNVNKSSGKCYQSNKRTYHQIRYQSDKLCKEYDLSVIDEFYESFKKKYKTSGKSWYENEQHKKGTSWKSKLQFDIDRVIKQAKDWDDFLKKIQDLGYEIKQGKHIAFKHKDKARFTRSKTIGEDYTEERIKYRITEEPKGRVAQALNSLADTINDMLVNNMKNGLDLENNSINLLNTVATLNTAANESAASLEETAAAIEEITSNIASSSQNILKMVSFANKVSISARDGEDLANKTTIAMDYINEEVTAINEAISVIDQIAFQTNILSLNAAVEAATAGEAGKGFAVVAGEVRNLASRSAEAAKEIKELVEKATVKANDGKNISNKMIEGYTELKNNINETLLLIKGVETSSKEQKQGIEQINDAIAMLDRQTQQNANVANQSNDIAIITERIAATILEDVEKKNFIGKTVN